MKQQSSKENLGKLITNLKLGAIQKSTKKHELVKIVQLALAASPPNVVLINEINQLVELIKNLKKGTARKAGSA
ncbi:hypothetical protein AX14_001867 [Amanita brunnescens Koide BX004]|nr:hypothetical protein AX14_001867 [Amanita brunnescens Koide BX004]